uniref:Uncharacterized protein n=1 Tax=Strongyloides venezuelensis TaxID=75913 RepID=A0A0K0FCM1_STRVS
MPLLAVRQFTTGLIIITCGNFKLQECSNLSNNEVSDYNIDERIAQEETISEIFRENKRDNIWAKAREAKKNNNVIHLRYEEIQGVAINSMKKHVICRENIETILKFEYNSKFELLLRSFGKESPRSSGQLICEKVGEPNPIAIRIGIISDLSQGPTKFNFQNEVKENNRSVNKLSILAIWFDEYKTNLIHYFMKDPMQQLDNLIEK